ncbi:MAG: hypothetical protein VW169_00790 [Rhodospirillaceae bacterium]
MDDDFGEARALKMLRNCLFIVLALSVSVGFSDSALAISNKQAFRLVVDTPEKKKIFENNKALMKFMSYLICGGRLSCEVPDDVLNQMISLRDQNPTWSFEDVYEELTTNKHGILSPQSTVDFEKLYYPGVMRYVFDRRGLSRANISKLRSEIRGRRKNCKREILASPPSKRIVKDESSINLYCKYRESYGYALKILAEKKAPR